MVMFAFEYRDLACSVANPLKPVLENVGLRHAEEVSGRTLKEDETVRVDSWRWTDLCGRSMEGDMVIANSNSVARQKT